jgi:hypothetical protein
MATLAPLIDPSKAQLRLIKRWPSCEALVHGRCRNFSTHVQLAGD